MGSGMGGINTSGAMGGGGGGEGEQEGGRTTELTEGARSIRMTSGWYNIPRSYIFGCSITLVKFVL